MRLTDDGRYLVRDERPPALVSDQPPPPRATHVHIHLPAPPRPARTADQARRRPQRDQDPEPGSLICKIGQHGTTGEWSGTDCDGRPLSVTTGADGMLEIRHGPGNGDQQDPVARDGNAGAPGENIPGKAYEARLAAAIAPPDRAHDRSPAALRGLQALLTSHYRRPVSQCRTLALAASAPRRNSNG
jgi:hypothetical protein